MTITGSNVGLHLLRCLVGGAARSKAETRLREVRVEDRREDLEDGLLDHAIQHGGNAEQTITAAVRFADGLPADRLRSVGAIQERLANGLPAWAEGRRNWDGPSKLGRG